MASKKYKLTDITRLRFGMELMIRMDVSTGSRSGVIRAVVTWNVRLLL